MAVPYKNIIFERDGNVAVVTINRPNSLNALNDETVDELMDAIDEVANDSKLRVLVITGAGNKAFVAGADINELHAIPNAAAGVEKAWRGQELMFKLERLPKPVIMAINGYALGGGCELAMAGDIRIAADTAKFGQPEINLGLIPGYGGSQRLPRLVGAGMAKLLIFSGEMIDAQEALRIGLVDKVVPASELMKEAKALAANLAQKAPIALAECKRVINFGLDSTIDQGCKYEAESFGVVCATEDMKEGTAAFLEKRKPSFKGR